MVPGPAKESRMVFGYGFYVSPKQTLKSIRVDHVENMEFWLTIDLTKFSFHEEHPIHQGGAYWDVVEGRYAFVTDLIDRKFSPPWICAYFTDESMTSIECNSPVAPSFYLLLQLQAKKRKVR